MTGQLYVVGGTNGTADRLRVFSGTDIPFVKPDPAVLPFWGAPAFRDEFDTVDARTPSGVNPDKWNVRDGQTLGYDMSYQTGRPENVHVANGNLILNAIRETGAVSLGGKVQPSDKPFTTGYIDTIGKHGSKYGRWEIRAKLNTVFGSSTGMWPALWFRPTNPPAGVDGEIDLMEAYGSPWIRNDYRLGSAQWTLWKDETSGVKTSGWLTPSPNTPDLATGFHTYILEWTPTSMKFYVDDYLAKTVTPADITWYDSSFNANFHTRIQIQVGKLPTPYWGNPDPAHPEWTASPSADFAIDYVRYYALPA